LSFSREKANQAILRSLVEATTQVRPYQQGYLSTA
jgi:hypothetical protein